MKLSCAAAALLTVIGSQYQEINGFVTPSTSTSLFSITSTPTATQSTKSTAKATNGINSAFAGMNHVQRGNRIPLQMGILDDLLKKGDTASRDFTGKQYLNDLQIRVDRINALEKSVEDLDDDELAAKSDGFRQRLSKGEDIDGPILEEAFATVREAAWRVLEQRHYDVQLVAGMILHDKQLAEMATGEGKTLVATLPTYLNALSGKTSFVITVNDYLAKRDAEKMGQVHRYLGLTVGLVQSNMEEDDRRKAYECDVVYVTNSELGFDYLRDHLALSTDQLVLPQKWSEGAFDGFCVVDEADSVLIDEARTPLVISKQVDVDGSKYKGASQVAEMLKSGKHYTVDLKNKNVIVNENGYDEVERILKIDSVFTIQKDGAAWASYINNACKAKELFTKDVEYAITTNAEGNKEIGIIDSFTGRVLDGRRWSDGLHQSIEAREGLDVSKMSQVIAKVTYQSFFRQFAGLSAMTGTALSDAEEFGEVYGLFVIPVPTALPLARRDYSDSIFKTRKAANDAVVREVINVGGGTEDGRPCLIGTTSVIQSRTIIEALQEKGIKAAVLNASPKNAPRESELIAQAGRPGVVTVATNIAGRGTDILLGGCPTTMSRIRARAYLLDQSVLKKNETELLPQSPDDSYYPCDVNEEETFLLNAASRAIKKEFGTSLTALKFDEILTIAADTTEGDDPDYVIQLRDAIDAIKDGFKEVLAEEKDIVKKLGGLYVMGTNRHDSSRIDNQLRGRAGRQGDPGSSRFFLSFEDEMFVTFGGDGLQNILKTFRVSDDMPVEAESVSKSLDSVQDTVETKFRDIRDEIRRFDSVLNSQRNKIYQDRREILMGSPADTIALMKEYNAAVVKELVEGQIQKKGGVINVEKVYQKISQFFPPVANVIGQDELMGYDAEGMTAFLNVVVDEVFDSITESMEKNAKAAKQPPNAMVRRASYITLVTHDNAWSNHLQNMEDMKETVGLRQYQGVDPFTEYQKDSFELYQGLLEQMRFDAVYSLWVSLK